jgi:hypothetical protein
MERISARLLLESFDTTLAGGFSNINFNGIRGGTDLTPSYFIYGLDAGIARTINRVTITNSIISGVVKDIFIGNNTVPVNWNIDNTNWFPSPTGITFTSGSTTCKIIHPLFLTENSGSVILLSGQNHIHVAHGLGITPSINDIQISRTGPISNCTSLWIDPSTITSAEFQVFSGTTAQKNTDVNILFNWQKK